jgi:hypothetical protein
MSNPAPHDLRLKFVTKIELAHILKVGFPQMLEEEILECWETLVHDLGVPKKVGPHGQLLCQVSTHGDNLGPVDLLSPVEEEKEAKRRRRRTTPSRRATSVSELQCKYQRKPEGFAEGAMQITVLKIQHPDRGWFRHEVPAVDMDFEKLHALVNTKYGEFMMMYTDTAGHWCNLTPDTFSDFARLLPRFRDAHVVHLCVREPPPANWETWAWDDAAKTYVWCAYSEEQMKAICNAGMRGQDYCVIHHDPAYPHRYYSYLIDFAKMQQTNLVTEEVRGAQ